MTDIPTGPNPLAAAWSILRSSRRRHPAPGGSGTIEHGELALILESLRSGGVAALSRQREALGAYRNRLVMTDPDTLSSDGALAYWLNLYNAGALDLAAETYDQEAGSVLRLPGGFTRAWARVGDEDLSLDDIEHGKVRRFRDPRIHAALVCGSASCPTVRYEPYDAVRLDHQLDDQMRAFLAAGGAVADEGAGELALSRIFRWYGGDFVRPHRMPTWLPPGKRRIVAALAPWLEPETARWVNRQSPEVVFQPYDWSLACVVR